jgi:hypothetical protein
VAEFPPEPTQFGFPHSWAIVAPSEGQVLYRITVEEKPAINDFLSNWAKHRPQMRGEPWVLYNGLSMFEDEGQAAELRDQLMPRQHVSPVPLPPRLGFSLARTRRRPGHYIVWGRPEDLLMSALQAQGSPVDKEYR